LARLKISGKEENPGLAFPVSMPLARDWKADVEVYQILSPATPESVSP
jgi:hypothetical protein